MTMSPLQSTRPVAKPVVRGRLRSVLTALVLATAVAPPLLYTDVASAQDERSGIKRVAVGSLTGSKTESARGWLVEGLEEQSSLEVLSGGDAAAIEHGASESEIAAHAAQLQADAVVLGTSNLKPKVGWVAEIYIHNGEDGALIEQVTVTAGAWNKYRAALGNASQYMDAIEQARLADPEPESEPEEDEELEEDEPTGRDEVATTNDSAARPSPLYARFGMRLYARSFRYTDPLREVFPGQDFPQMLTYNLAAAPMVFGRVDWYPLAHFQGGFPANVGISGGYELGVATDVEFRNRMLKQSHSLMYVGPKIRIPVATHEIGLFGHFGSHSFSIDGDAAANSGRDVFPDVTYRFLDFGADVRFLFDDIRLGAHAKYRMLLGYGDVASADWFPNTSGAAVNVGGEVGWKLTDTLELLVGVDVLQYGLDFSPAASAEPDRVAGGATDRYVSAWGALGFTWPGDGSTSVSVSTSGSSGETEKTDDEDSFADFDDF